MFDGDERVAGRVLDDLDLQPESFGSLGASLVAGIGADDAEHRVRQACFAEELVASGEVGDVSGGDEHSDEETQAVNDYVTFAASDLLASVVSDLLGAAGPPLAAPIIHPVGQNPPVQVR